LWVHCAVLTSAPSASWLMLALLLALATSTAHAKPLHDPYRECSQQTLETAIALERAGDREGLRDQVRSYGCRLIFPWEGFEQFPPERGRRPAWRRPLADAHTGFF